MTLTGQSDLNLFFDIFQRKMGNNEHKGQNLRKLDDLTLLHQLSDMI